jgi:hypothetical protein
MRPLAVPKGCINSNPYWITVIVHEPSTYSFLEFFVNYKYNYKKNVTCKDDIRTVVDIDPLLQLRSRVSLVAIQTC